MWKVQYTDEFRAGFESLTDEDEVASIRAAVRVLRDEGPSLPRPLADTLATSSYPNMKELRPLGTSFRILFAFDPRRVAILLLGGNKAGQEAMVCREYPPRRPSLCRAFTCHRGGTGGGTPS